MNGASPVAPIAYRVRFEPAQHRIEVEARVALRGETHLELMMAVWTPGSYMLREYARQVEAIAAHDDHGNPVAVTKVRKNRWHVTAPGTDAVVVRYRVYAREMTVRTSWVDAGFALLNGAATFITHAESLAQPHVVTVVRPEGWGETLTALPLQAGTTDTFVARDFDELVDSPFLLGNPVVQRFEVAGKEHVLATEGGGGVWDHARALDDVRALVARNHTLWGTLPYDRYVFMNLLTDGRGGLEHGASTVLMASRWSGRGRSEYVEWLGLVSHEFFHVWNIKRLRPVELGPFDYERETPTRSLWVAEGFTAYYDDLNVRRAGLCTTREYLERLSKAIEQLQGTAGRRHQALGDSSFDAWIKYYRRDENSDNATVSYYVKGTVVGFLLDAAIRTATFGRRSLDDLMRAAFARYGQDRGYADQEFRALASEIAERDLRPFFAAAVDRCDELDYTEALGCFGLRFGRRERDAKAEPSAWIGISGRLDSGRVVVSEVVRDGPAWQAGVNVDDELIAVDSYRLPPGRWQDRLKGYRSGSVASVLVARREELVRLALTFGEEPVKAWQLAEAPDASDAQKATLAEWLTGGPVARPLS